MKKYVTNVYKSKKKSCWAVLSSAICFCVAPPPALPTHQVELFSALLSEPARPCPCGVPCSALFIIWLRGFTSVPTHISQTMRALQQRAFPRHTPTPRADAELYLYSFGFLETPSAETIEVSRSRLVWVWRGGSYCCRSAQTHPQKLVITPKKTT